MTPQKLKESRLKAGLTQTQAADLACVTTRAWQQYESGDRTPSRAVVELFKLKIQIKEKDEEMSCIKDLEKLFAQDGWTHESVFEECGGEEGTTDIRTEVHSKLGDIEIEYLSLCVTICNTTKEILNDYNPRDIPDFPSYFTLSRGIIIEGEEVDRDGVIKDPYLREEDEDIALEDLLPRRFTEYDDAAFYDFIEKLKLS